MTCNNGVEYYQKQPPTKPNFKTVKQGQQSAKKLGVSVATIAPAPNRWQNWTAKMKEADI